MVHEGDARADVMRVALPLPLDLCLEETQGGVVFVAEIVPGGNAERAGGVCVGDVVEAVCVPYGDVCVPVVNPGGLDMVESFVETRDSSEAAFIMQLRRTPGGIDAFQVASDEHVERVAKLNGKLEATFDRIFEEGYIFAPPDEEEELEFDALRDYGFEVDYSRLGQLPSLEEQRQHLQNQRDRWASPPS